MSIENFYVNSGEKDGRFTASFLGNSFSNSDPSISVYWSFVSQTHGFSIFDTSIPSRAIIISANLKYIGSNSTLGGLFSSIHGVKHPNPAIPISFDDCFNADLTINSVNWNFPTQSYPIGYVYVSPNISPIIQELVNQDGFSGRIYIQHRSTSAGASSGSIPIYQYDFSPQNAPVLEVHYAFKGKIFIYDAESPANLSATSEEAVKDVDIGDRPIRP